MTKKEQGKHQKKTLFVTHFQDCRLQVMRYRLDSEFNNFLEERNGLIKVIWMCAILDTDEECGSKVAKGDCVVMRVLWTKVSSFHMKGYGHIEILKRVTQSGTGAKSKSKVIQEKWLLLNIRSISIEVFQNINGYIEVHWVCIRI